MTDWSLSESLARSRRITCSLLISADVLDVKTLDDANRVEWHFGDVFQSIQNKACTSAMVLGGVQIQS